MIIKSFTSGIYYFRMVSYNETGSRWSNEIAIDVQIPNGSDGSDKAIPFGNYHLLFTAIAIIALVIVKKWKFINNL